MTKQKLEGKPFSTANASRDFIRVVAQRIHHQLVKLKRFQQSREHGNYQQQQISKGMSEILESIESLNSYACTMTVSDSVKQIINEHDPLQQQQLTHSSTLFNDNIGGGREGGVGMSLSQYSSSPASHLRAPVETRLDAWLTEECTPCSATAADVSARQRTTAAGSYATSRNGARYFGNSTRLRYPDQKTYLAYSQFLRACPMLDRFLGPFQEGS
eukprot:6214285-Pleurochrysis_carterae.AAC.1